MKLLHSLVFLAITCHNSFAEDPIAIFKRNFPPLATCQFAASVRTLHNGQSAPVTIDYFTVSMNPPRWKIVQKSSATALQDGKTITTTVLGEEISLHTGDLSMSTDPSTGRIISGVAAHVKPLEPSISKYAGFGPFSFAVDGRIPMNDQLSLAELIDQSVANISSDIINKKQCIHISSNGVWGNISMWLDPTHGYMPLRVLQNKSAGDLTDDRKPLQSYFTEQNNLKLPLEQWFQDFEISRIELISGRRIITAFTRHCKSTYKTGITSEVTETVQLLNVKAVPNWDSSAFAVSTIIPDGTPVTALDDKPIRYEWRGGKIVKLVNPDAVASAGAQGFVPPARNRAWLWATAAVVVGLAVALTAWIRMRMRRAS